MILRLMKLPFSLPLLAACSLAVGSIAQESQPTAWQTNYTAALKTAEKGGKDILLVFTATDWVQICELFDRDILRQKDFIERASTDFELVHLEYPKEGYKQSAFLKKQNALLRNAYRISAFPIVMLTDVEGRPYAMTGYQSITPAQFGEKVKLMRQTHTQRDETFARADAVSGIEKAKLLTQGIPELPGNLTARYYRPQVEALIAADPDTTLARTRPLQRMLADVQYTEEMKKLSEEVKWPEMIELTDNYIADNNLQGAQRQQALLNKLGIYQSQGKTMDYLATLLMITKIDPETPTAKRAQSMLDEIRANKLTNGN